MGRVGVVSTSRVMRVFGGSARGVRARARRSAFRVQERKAGVLPLLPLEQ